MFSTTFVRFTLVVVLLGILGTLTSRAYADQISFTGNLATDATFLPPGPTFTDGDYAQYAAVVKSFTVTAASEMKAITFSYGGGTNAHGAVIPEGGFEPYLSLFDSAGDFLASTFFGVTCPVGAQTNSVSGQCFDVELDGGVLNPGTYEIAISAFENMSFAENFGSGTLADGFTGLGNLQPGEDLNYAFDVDLTPTAPVPEPGTSIALLAGLLTFACFRNRTKELSTNENKE